MTRKQAANFATNLERIARELSALARLADEQITENPNLVIRIGCTSAQVRELSNRFWAIKHNETA